MSTPNAHTDTATREQWLEKAINAWMRPTFAQLGYTIPDVVHVSVGFGSGKTGGESSRIPGECWSGIRSPDSNPHIFISPFEGDAVEVLCTLVHLCIHAVLDPDMSHTDPFKVAAQTLGLVGRMDATTGDLSLREQFAEMVAEDGELGPYPHPALELLPSLAINDPSRVVALTGGSRKAKTTSGKAKQVNRWIKVSCPEHPDAPTVNTARKTVREDRAPLCGEPVMVVPDDGDLAAITTRPCGVRLTAKIEELNADGRGAEGDADGGAAEAS